MTTPSTEELRAALVTSISCEWPKCNEDCGPDYCKVSHEQLELARAILPALIRAELARREAQGAQDWAQKAAEAVYQHCCDSDFGARGKLLSVWISELSAIIRRAHAEQDNTSGLSDKCWARVVKDAEQQPSAELGTEYHRAGCSALCQPSAEPICDGRGWYYELAAAHGDESNPCIGGDVHKRRRKCPGCINCKPKSAEPICDGSKGVGSKEMLERVNVLQAERDALAQRVAELEQQLPEGMESCTIRFLQCVHGHGWLTARNWIQHGCPTCERNELAATIVFKDERFATLERDNATLRARLAEANSPVRKDMMP